MHVEKTRKKSAKTEPNRTDAVHGSVKNRQESATNFNPDEYAVLRRLEANLTGDETTKEVRELAREIIAGEID